MNSVGKIYIKVRDGMKSRNIGQELIIYSFKYCFQKAKLHSLNGSLHYDFYFLAINGRSLFSIQYDRFQHHKSLEIHCFFFFAYRKRRHSGVDFLIG